MEKTSSFKVRAFQQPDLPACAKLYLDGLLGGKLAENDTGLDIDDIDSAYMGTEGNHFWVAEVLPGNIVGMIGVQHHEQNVGQIRRLRVAPEFQRRGIGKALLETAIRFCRENQYLKVSLESFAERSAALELFRRLGFQLGETRHFAGKEMIYFYFDLYAGPPKPPKGDEGIASQAAS
jgi:ribosomal protein S18 acetylase RimI-like enzyme